MTKRERLIAIGAGVAGGALLLNSFLIAPLEARWDAADQRRDSAQEEVERGQAVMNNRNRSLRVWKTLADGTLADDAPTAESRLLEGVRVWAQNSGVDLTSLKPEQGDREQGFGRLVVRAQANGDMAALSTFLQGAENSDLPVRLVDMTLASRKDGQDELSLQVGFSTIYQLPPEQPNSRRVATR